MAVFVGVSGRKKSGKSSLADRLERAASDLWPTRSPFGQPLPTFVRRLPMAEPIKGIAVDLLELDPALVYGTDAEKETPTRYRWGDMPHYERMRTEWLMRSPWPESGLPQPPPVPAADAFMTVRQILQEIGSGWFRRLRQDVWISRWRRHARATAQQNPSCVVLADDVRFPNELEGLKEEGAYLVRLTRGVRGDAHESEQDLDDSPLFDFVVDADLDADRTFTHVVLAMVRDGFVTSANADTALSRMAEANR